MAQKRTQVARLNVDNISTGAIASPVDTYVRPIETQSTPSALSQFVTALAPAVEAKANKELEVKLKREREIENFNYKKRMQHVENQAFITRANQISDYNNNPELYHQTDQAVIIDKYKKHTFDNIEQMKKEGADELQIQNYALKMETHNIELIAKINEGKKGYVKGEENKSIVNTAIAFTQTNKEITDENIKLFKEIWDGNAEAHVIYDAKTKRNKPDHKRMNDLAIKLATDLSKSDPNNIVLAYLEKEKILNVKENIAIRSTLRAARDKSILKVNTATLKRTGISESINNNITNGTTFKDNIIYKNTQGFDVKATDLETQEELFKSDLFKNYGKNKSKLYAESNFIPPVVKTEVISGLKWLKDSVGSTPEHNEIIQQSYFTWAALKNAGNDMSFLSEEDNLRFEAIDMQVQDAAATGNLYKTEGLDEPEADFGVREVIQLNFNNASAVSRRINFDNFKQSTTLKDTVANELDVFNFFGADLSEVNNTKEVQAEVAKNAHFLHMANPELSEALVVKKAADMARKDWVVIQSGFGKYYAFKHLNTNVDAKINPSSIIPKYNQQLIKDNRIKNFVFKELTLKQGQFDVAVEPDKKDPNKVHIALYEVDEEKNRVYKGQIGGAVDKNKLLNDAEILNQLIATGMNEEMQETLTYSMLPKTKTNNIIDLGIMQSVRGKPQEGIVTIPEKQSSFLDVINPISTATASTLDGTEEAFVPSNQPTTGENVTMEGNTIAEKTASLISTQEGFRASPYADGKDKSVGYGFYLPSLEPDEKALIKDINNVTIEEGKAVLGLKIQKISNFLNDKIENFTNLPEKAQMAVTSMGYQLGVTNIPRVWKKFTAAITEAAQYAEGSAEQAQALGKAQFEMLYNISKDGTISLNKWATQTKKRAFEMAEAVGDTTVEYANEASSSILDIIFPKAEASTIKVQGTYKTNEEPNADTVTAIAKSRNPALETMKYVGISEGNSEGAQAIMKLWEGVTGNWQKKGESVADFVSNNSWCALFVTQVLRDSGIDTSKFGKNKWDLVRAKTYQTVGESIYNGKAAEGQPRGSFNNVKAGDILVKEHTPEERKMYKLGFGHAGIVIKVEGDEVYFIAGNSSDQVKMSSYNIKEKANNLTIRRVKGTKDIPADSVPSYLEVKVKGDYTKFKNSMTSLYKWAIN